jgi:hypothetical protein
MPGPLRSRSGVGKLLCFSSFQSSEAVAGSPAVSDDEEPIFVVTSPIVETSIHEWILLVNRSRNYSLVCPEESAVNDRGSLVSARDELAHDATA